jgi:hypothetical protein
LKVTTGSSTARSEVGTKAKVLALSRARDAWGGEGRGGGQTGIQKIAAAHRRSPSLPTVSWRKV